MAGATTARTRMLLGVLAAAVLVLSTQGSASGAGLGDPPPDCGAVGKDYSDPSCTTQTRNGTFSLSGHVVRPGETLTGTISNRCTYHSTGDYSQPPDKPCPVDWSQLAAVGKHVSGCADVDSSCIVRIPKSAKARPYTIVTVGIRSDQGTGISKDYYGIRTGSDPPVDWDFDLHPVCGKDLCKKPARTDTEPTLRPFWHR